MLSPVKCGIIGLLKKILMTKDEIIDELKSLNIVHSVGDEYFITSEYLDLTKLKSSLRAVVTIIPEVKEKVQDKVLEVVTGRWPMEIETQTGKQKTTALLDMCKVKSMDDENKYLLRTYTSESGTYLLKLMEDEAYDPTTVIEVVTKYYSNLEKPKSFAKFLLEGVFEQLYTEYVEGDLFKTMGGKKDNQKWR